MGEGFFMKFNQVLKIQPRPYYVPLKTLDICSKWRGNVIDWGVWMPFITFLNKRKLKKKCWKCFAKLVVFEHAVTM